MQCGTVSFPVTMMVTISLKVVIIRVGIKKISPFIIVDMNFLWPCNCSHPTIYIYMPWIPREEEGEE